MASSDPQAMLNALLQPWQAALAEPAKAQQEVLHRLLEGYAQTDYGTQRDAAHLFAIKSGNASSAALTLDTYPAWCFEWWISIVLASIYGSSAS